MSTAERIIPPLCAGQRLTVEEFLCRWEAMPEVNVFTGVGLDGTAVLQGDVALLLRTLQRSLESARHAAFVMKLAGRKSAG